MLKEGAAVALQQTLRALADPTRREILNLLKGGRLSAGEISALRHLGGGHFAAPVGAAAGRPHPG